MEIQEDLEEHRDKIMSLRGNLYRSNGNVHVWCPYSF